MTTVPTRPHTERPNAAPVAQHHVYFFGNGSAEGTRDMKRLLGSKGANLAEMTNLGVPVPPGFTISCSACMQYLNSETVPEGLPDEVVRNLRKRILGR